MELMNQSLKLTFNNNKKKTIRTRAVFRKEHHFQPRFLFQHNS